ncbi:ABC Fe(3+) transporter [Rhodococcus rhodnii LMG 5362]|uniref:ABC Fe(3+) transporter n=1 Tax=Rhodococcus rhodnii LMG 5362 TaxID=1273125 RepID=R7WJK4_9NOCA|nr:ABC Fe(3+) transporter [Rhodococcus rhodnii LMG 5362]
MRALTGAAIAAALAATTACSSDAEPDTTAAAASYSVEHARGTLDVPAAPERVVVLEPVQLDTSIALGVVPVGAAVASEAVGVPPYLGEEGEAVEVIGTVPQPNLEQIAALAPDLILGTESRHAELYDSLAAIAPTAFMDSQADPWRDNVDFVARALGQPDAGSTVLAEYDERCAEIEATHETSDRTAQLVRPRDDMLTLYGPVSFAGNTLECAGFTIPPRDWEDSISVDLSPELAGEAQADLVVVTSNTPDDPSTMPAAITSNEQFFPNLHLVDAAYWISGVGPIGGAAVLDDLDRILAEEG